MVIDLSKFVQSTGWLLLIGIVGGIWGLIEAKNAPRRQHFFDRAMLKLPIIGSILNKSAIARLRAHAVDNVRSRRAARGSARLGCRRHGYIVYESAVYKCATSGHGPAPARGGGGSMENTSLFPNMVTR